MGDRKGLDFGGRGGGEELVEIDGKETILRLYYMRNKSVFNKRGNKNKFLFKKWNKTKQKVWFLFCLAGVDLRFWIFFKFSVGVNIVHQQTMFEQQVSFHEDSFFYHHKRLNIIIAVVTYMN